MPAKVVTGMAARKKNSVKTGVTTRRSKKKVSEEPDNVKPEDSISQVGVKSNVSVTTSVAARRLQLLTEKANIEAQLQIDQMRQTLEVDELKLRQRREEMHMKMQLLQLEAEEKALKGMISAVNDTAGPVADQVNVKQTNKVDDRSSVLTNVTNISAKANPNKSSPGIDNTKQDGSLNVQVPMSTASPQPVVNAIDNSSIAQLILDGQRQQHELIDSIRLPNTQTLSFDGDALKYWPFVRAFENVIDKSQLDDNAKLLRLVQCCTKEAKKIIEACLFMDGPAGYTRARKLLKDRFGNEYKIAQAWILKITNTRVIRGNDCDKLQEYADDLSCCYDTLVSMKQLAEVNCQATLCSILEKLPNYLQARFKHEVRILQERSGRNPEFADVVTFVKQAATEANHPVYGSLATGRESASALRSHTVTTAATARDDDSWSGPASTPRYDTSASRQDGFQLYGTQRQQLRCFLCQEEHDLFRCAQFKAMNVDRRIEVAKQHRLCFNCLRSGHNMESCRLERRCSVPGCGKKHTKFLHQPAAFNAGRQQSNTEEATLAQTLVTDAGSRVVNGHIGAGSIRSGLPIVPVKVLDPVNKRSVHTYALLDNGSTNSFCTANLAQQLGLRDDHKEMLSLSTLEKANSNEMTRVVSMNVCDINGKNMINMATVYVRMNLPIGIGNKATSVDIDKLPHLRTIQLPEVNAGGVELIIGQDVPEALMPREVLTGEPGSAYAVKYLLGWTLNGPLDRSCNAIQNASIHFVTAEADLESQVERFWTLDSVPVRADPAEWSRNDLKAVELWRSTTEYKGGHYEAAVPFRNDHVYLPDNELMARERLLCLQRKLQKNPQLHNMYNDFMSDLVIKGYAETIPVDNHAVDKPKWYLPHHPVFNQNKPGKIRVVFDCSARYNGISLNDCTLQGPDLTNKLTGVLLRFRQGQVAFMADIQSMFYQVHVKPEQRDVLRYLWWPDGDLRLEPVKYRMTVHPFGGVWSPSCCSYVLHRTAEDRALSYSKDTLTTVLRNFYVDDCLKSVGSVQDAVKLVNELRKMLLEGGFRLTKWVCSNPAVLAMLPESELGSTMKSTELMSVNSERALGVKWNIDSDQLGVSISFKDKPLTRKGMLSIISSVFDPLGYVSPFVLSAKKILQEACRRQIGWDDALPLDLMSAWKAWLEDQPTLEAFGVQRCIIPGGFKTANVELHHFSDASRDGYGTASYMRITDNYGNVACSLVLAKTRLAPIRQATIPRLELAAATMSVVVDKYLRAEFDIKIDESVFWTDSTIVLQYIHSEDRRFHTFVANRVSQIREGSDPSQWRYVNTRHNPADFASRGLKAHELIDNKLWREGPEFLLKNKSEWPEQPALIQKLSDNDPEVRKEQVVYAVQSTKNLVEDAMNRMYSRYSTFYRLKRAIAWILRVKQLLLTKCRGLQLPNMHTSLSVLEVQSAENEIWKLVQAESFPDLYHEPNKSLKRSDFMHRLEPQMVNGLLRLGGRLPTHQIILPKNHIVVELLIKQCHEQSAHAGREHVLSVVREKFWVIGARKAVKKVLRECRYCRLKFSKPQGQKMANLPRERLTSDEPPFTCTGVDYFGPLLVKSGRNELKRYGCLFTCFASRAIHIEIAHSLESDSFLNAFQRFAARRGQPRILWSDNGTNFIGANKELQSAIKSPQVEAYLTRHCIQWKFNPPSASHMGGVWERLIRSVRKVLTATANHQTLSDESLHTFMCLAEDIINSRPLSAVSDDPRDFNPLTPNQLLQMRPTQFMPLGTFDAKDLYTRRRWRQNQYLADLFWSRWRNEYLPTLQLRTKWLSSKRNLRVGDVVLLVDDQLPRNCWSLGRIAEVFVAADGHVRSVRVATRDSSFVRPVHKLCLVESSVDVED
jgi:transposase InsO family protein